MPIANGQLPPLTVKSTISDVVCLPSKFSPVVTRNLETVIQKYVERKNYIFKLYSTDQSYS